jgi:hypothetical protein
MTQKWPATQAGEGAGASAKLPSARKTRPAATTAISARSQTGRNRSTAGGWGMREISGRKMKNHAQALGARKKKHRGGCSAVLAVDFLFLRPLFLGSGRLLGPVANDFCGDLRVTVSASPVDTYRDLRLEN